MYLLNAAVADDAGRLYATLDPPAPDASFNNGIAFAPDGAVHVTENLAPDDGYIAGRRISATGQLVIQLM